ncbi:MAG TPA: amidohydrolase family protein [Acidimicrobiia bacterium]|nr:amidohydrolase family protein [Acidimicrobiia bacterium]
MNGKILLKGGCVLTLDPKSPNLRQGDVLIEDGRIAEIGEGLRLRDAETVDATNTVVMPGFVDTHRHAWESLFRNFGEGGPSAEATVSPEAYGSHYTPEDVYASTLIGLLGAAEAGITSVVDWSDIQLEPTYFDAALEAHADAGLRTVLVHSVPAWAENQEAAGSALGRLVAGRTNPEVAMTTIAYGAVDPGPSDRQQFDVEGFQGDWKSARESGVRIHAHAGTDSSSGGVVAEMAAKGLLGEDVTLVHCTNLNDDDLDAVSSTGTRVALAPSSEMAGGRGSLTIQRLIDRGIRPGLAVDTERVAPGDMFAQMRAAISMQHATFFDLKLAGKAGLPQLLSTREVIRYATIDGARVAGLGGVTGSLVPGKRADLVVLRTDRPNIFPINDPIGAVVWGMDTSNVDWVIADGRILMRNGVLEADVERARNLARAAQQRVGAASGVLVGTGQRGPA